MEAAERGTKSAGVGWGGNAVQSEHENSLGPNLEAEEELNHHGPIMTYLRV